MEASVLKILFINMMWARKATS